MRPDNFIIAKNAVKTANLTKLSGSTQKLLFYYSGLSIGKLYTVRGVLIDRETNSPVLIGGDEVAAEKTFRALSVTGSVSTEFVFDSASLKGKSVVVF